MGEFVVYIEGLCFASVCSSLSQQEVEAKMKMHLCGTSTGWILDSEPFNNGMPNPSPCDQQPETHKHYLFAA